MTQFDLGWPISLIKTVLCCKHIPGAMPSESKPKIIRRLVGQDICDPCTSYKSFRVNNPLILKFS